jgi:Fe-S cluster biogenesis protein NfuA
MKPEEIIEAEIVINRILDEGRPYLKVDGGDVELVGISADGFITLRFLGACAECSFMYMTYQAGFERQIREYYPQTKILLMNDRVECWPV